MSTLMHETSRVRPGDGLARAEQRGLLGAEHGRVGHLLHVARHDAEPHLVANPRVADPLGQRDEAGEPELLGSARRPASSGARAGLVTPHRNMMREGDTPAARSAPKRDAWSARLAGATVNSPSPVLGEASPGRMVMTL